MKKHHFNFIAAMFMVLTAVSSCKKPVPPAGLTNKVTVHIDSIYNIYYNEAMASAHISNFQQKAMTQHGFCWDTLPEPDINDNHTQQGVLADTSFSGHLTDLAPSTRYFVRSYIQFGSATAYSQQDSLVTLPSTPVVITAPITQVTSTSALSGGEVTSDGGAPVTARGVCWSTNANPTTADNTTSNGSGTGQFTANLTGLNAPTTYYVRAYATNIAGTAYGNEISFTTSCPATVTDYDGNVYAVVQIGNQCWMAENLKTTHYANGVAIQNVTDLSAWQNLSITDKARCVYNNSSSNFNIYGYLYTWAAVMNGAASSTTNPSGVQGICPNGWHVPSDAEWDELVNYLGGSSVAGGKMKETGTAHWNNPNTGATNSSGWSGLPGGIRNTNGNFNFLGHYGYWWSSKQYNTSNALHRILYYNAGNVTKNATGKANGLSCRCVRD